MKYDIRNHCFQDAAGTVPAVVDGDRVRYLSPGELPPLMPGGYRVLSVRCGPYRGIAAAPEPEDDTPDEPNIVTG